MHEDWKEYTQTILTKFRGVLTKYIEDVNIDRIKQWPEKFGFEQIRFIYFLNITIHIIRKFIIFTR